MEKERWGSIPFNYIKNVEWIADAYRNAGATFSNGFQKDAIQNCVGAKRNSDFKDWKCDISVIKNEKGVFIVVEDTGTLGLIGENRTLEEIKDLTKSGFEFTKDDRLSRFMSMYNSGGNTGPGLYGAGKAVYSYASETFSYYYDSIRSTDGKYIANCNVCGDLWEKALEGEEAKDFIKKETGFDPKESAGTRIIIANPKKELIASIENGEFVSDIQESWWLTMERLGKDSCISVNGVPVTVPDDIRRTKYAYELPKPENFDKGYRVKHFGLYVFPEGGNRWSGISYYRKGMKIGEVRLRNVEKNFNGCFWGYIDVDEPWQKELEGIENNVHFGVSKLKMNKRCYKNLIEFCSTRFDRLMEGWGLVKTGENNDRKLRERLKKISDEVQGLFDKLGYEKLGNAPKKDDFNIRWQNVRYPAEGIEVVTGGDTIGFTICITNPLMADGRFDYRLYVKNAKTGEVVSEIKEGKGKATVKAGTTFRKRFEFEVTEESAERHAENRIVLSVRKIGGGEKKQKELHFFYDTDKPEHKIKRVEVSVNNITPPNEHSRRVNFGQKLLDVSYKVENRRNETLKYQLNISIHKAEGDHPMITPVAQMTGEVGPFDEDVPAVIREIPFDEETYREYPKGPLELRARLVCTGDSDREFEAGEKIDMCKRILFLNCNENRGGGSSFEPVCTDQPDNSRRAWFNDGSEKQICINVGHKAYKDLSENPDMQYRYMREQMIKQFVLLYFSEGRYDLFEREGEDFETLSPMEIVDRVMDKIESVYLESLR